jgi:hypothetical protein
MGGSWSRGTWILDSGRAPTGATPCRQHTAAGVCEGDSAARDRGRSIPNGAANLPKAAVSKRDRHMPALIAAPSARARAIAVIRGFLSY